MKRSRFANFIMFSLFALFFVLLIWTIWANTALEVNHYSISPNNLPEEFNGFRIAHVSDLHNTRIGNDNEKLLSLIEKARPDIIVITGDIVDCHRTDIDVAEDFSRRAMNIAPCFYVTGNHEATLDEFVYKQLEKALLSNGVRILHDESYPLEREGEYIELIGLDDPEFRDNEDEDNAIANIIDELGQQDTFSLVLSHRPEYFEDYVNSCAELVLCGHTHGGQFRLPFIGGLVAPGQGIFPEYDAGLFTVADTSMIVNRGIGNSLMPIRFNNRPELVIIELLHK